ncbi:PIN domain-containing protein [Streptomyces microflavus]|uniref:PIN domain-containing protein n=1 Tax=Streptomyces microflavus TaxID=1919 RepID=UPI00369DC207
MIILDTQVVRGMAFDSAEARLVRVIRKSETDRVALPWMAFEERLAQYVLAYEDAHRKAESVHRELARKLPPPVDVTAPTLIDPDQARKLWDARLRELVEVIPTSGEIFQEALKREANEQRPAGKKGDTKTGARDVAIWLTAIEYARAHPDETVYFISGNTRDFTDGKVDYPAPMDADRNLAGGNFVHLTKLSEVLAKLASAVSVEEDDVKARLRSSSWSVQRAALSSWADARGLMSTPVTALWRTSGEVEQVRFVLDRRKKYPFVTTLLDVEDIKAYRLGDDIWCTAKMTWQFIGPALETSRMDYSGALDLACCTWTSHVMLPLTEGVGPVPQIFDTRRPEAPQASDDIDWPETAAESRRDLWNRSQVLADPQKPWWLLSSGDRGEGGAWDSDRVASLWPLLQSRPSTLAVINSLLWAPLGSDERREKAELDVELGELETEFDGLDPDEREAAIDAARAETHEDYEHRGSDPEETEPKS